MNPTDAKDSKKEPKRLYLVGSTGKMFSVTFSELVGVLSKSEIAEMQIAIQDEMRLRGETLTRADIAKVKQALAPKENSIEMGF